MITPPLNQSRRAGDEDESPLLLSQIKRILTKVSPNPSLCNSYYRLEITVPTQDNDHYPPVQLWQLTTDLWGSVCWAFVGEVILTCLPKNWVATGNITTLQT